MNIIHSKDEIISTIKSLKKNKTIGFVPTMGALHKGHLELVKKSIANNDYCVVSIFVNPTQFNNASDLEKYPRNFELDCKLLESIGCHIVFAPDVTEMYSQSEIDKTFSFNFSGLDEVMEGKFRPGHFNGVVQVVNKLFQLIKPNRAYFGEKDFQQLAIIHHMVSVYNLPIEIIDCPIVREENGLAMSSRNARLSEIQKKEALTISATLFESKEICKKISPNELITWVENKIQSNKSLKLEYFDIVNTKTLKPISSWNEPSIGCIAVFCGEIRLIDNIRYN